MLLFGILSILHVCLLLKPATSILPKFKLSKGSVRKDHSMRKLVCWYHTCRYCLLIARFLTKH